MNPLIEKLLYKIVVAALVALGAKLSLDPDTQAGLVSEVAPWLVAAALAWWSSHREQRVENTRAALPAGATVQEAKLAIKKGHAPPATLPGHRRPFLRP